MFSTNQFRYSAHQCVILLLTFIFFFITSIHQKGISSSLIHLAESAPSVSTLQNQGKPFKNVLVYGGCENPLAHLGEVSKFVRDTPLGLMDFSMLVPPLIQKEFQLSDTQGIDLTQRVAFAIFKQEQKKEGTYALLFKMKDRAFFEKSLPQDPAKGGLKPFGTNAHSYLNPNTQKPMYVNFIESFAVFSSDPFTFKENKTFLTALASFVFQNEGIIYFEFDNFKSYFQEEIQKFETDLKSSPRKKKAGSSSKGNINEEAFQQYLEYFVDLAMDEISQGMIILKSATSGMQIEMRLRPKLNGDVSKQIKKIKAKKHTLLYQLVHTSPVLISTSLGNYTEALTTLLKSEFYKRTLALISTNHQLQKRSFQNIEKLGHAINGEFAMYFSLDQLGQKNLSMVFLMKPKDAQKYKEAFKENIRLTHLMSTSKFKENESQYLKENAYSIGQYSVLVGREVINPLAESDDPSVLEDNILERHTIIDPTFILEVVDPAPKKKLTDLLRHKGAQSHLGIDSVMRMLPTLPLGFIYFSPVDIMKAFFLRENPQFRQQVQGIKGLQGLAISFGQDEGDLHLTLSVPQPLLKESMNAFMQLKMLGP